MPTPIEVIENVVDFVAVNPVEDITVYPTLLACALTCRAVTVRSHCNLYRHVILRTPSQMAQFTRALTERSNVINMVFELTVLPPASSYVPLDRKSTRLNSSHSGESRMPSSA